MQYLTRAVCGLAMAVLSGLPLAAQTNPVVVELYTSQGCSSCPPADDYMARFADDAQVILLSLHVDYWDYIGWADQFASPAFTARQKSYAHAIGSRRIYTPQMVVGGQDRIEGFDVDTFGAALTRHRAADSGVQVALARSGGSLTITAQAGRAFDAPARVDLVRYTPAQTIEIKRGENAGHTITYRNIVTSWQTIGEWNGAAPLALQVQVSGAEPAVVIVQSAGPAQILAAARVR